MTLMQTQHMTNHQTHLQRNRKGGAMIETIFAIPFVLVFIVLFFYFGNQGPRRTADANMARYEAWRKAEIGTPGPAANGANASQLNEAYYNNPRPTITVQSVDDRWFPDDALERVQEEVSDQTIELVEEVHEKFPHGQRFSAIMDHPVFLQYIRDINLHQTSAIHHIRQDGDWRYADAVKYHEIIERWGPDHERYNTTASELRDVFFDNFDNQLANYDHNPIGRSDA